jgi:hypothetical protein
MKHSLKFFAALPLLALSFFASPGKAQIISRGDLFGPGAPPPMFGVEIGLGKHSQQGSFQASCGCTFDQGDGNGILGDLFFELPIDYEWAVGLKAGYDHKHVTSNAVVSEVAVVQDAAGNTDTAIFSDIGRTSSVTTKYIIVEPYAQYQFFRMGPFVQAGPSLGFLIGSSFEQDRVLNTTHARVQGQDVQNLRFENGTTTEQINPPAPIVGASGMRLGIVLSAGYNIQVSERSVFSPLISYDLPLTVISTTNATGWKIGSVYASALLKFRLD